MTALPLFVLVPLLLVSIALAARGYQRVRSNMDSLLRAREIKELALTSLGLVLTQDDVSKAILLNPDNLEAAGRKIEAYDSNLEVLKRLNTIAGSDAIERKVQMLMDKDEALRPKDAAILEMAFGGQIEQARKAYYSELQPLRSDYEGLVHELVKLASSNADDAVNRVEKQQKSTFVVNSVTLGVGILLVGVLLTLSAGRLRRLLLETLTALEAVGDGDFTRRLADDQSENEIGRMRRAFNRAASTMAEAFRRLSQTAGTLGGQSSNLKVVSQSLQQDAAGAFTQATSATLDLRQVNLHVQTLAGNMREFRSSISDISQGASRAAQVAASAVARSEVAKGCVQQLGARSVEVGAVTVAIDRIARQTTMLALNATIEAARAGKFGQSFSVVAAEVKDLSLLTAEQTEVIRRAIDAIQDDINQTIAAMSEVDAIITEIDGYQKTISASVTEQSVTAQQIGDTLSAVAQTSAGVATNVGELAQVVEKTARQSQSIDEEAVRLGGAANELSGFISAFRYDDRPAS
jgi:methyl-accepting chemotaxis protein